MGTEDVITIVSMEFEHLPDIQIIEQRSFASPWSYSAFLSELFENDNAFYLVAQSRDTVVGYVGVWIILDEGHITNIAVDPRYRGRGIGSRLLQAVTAVAQTQGVTRMTLEVRVSNIEAQRLYRRLGYEVSGVRKQYYRDNNEDALIMWRDLTKDAGGETDSRNRNKLR